MRIHTHVLVDAIGVYADMVDLQDAGICEADRILKVRDECVTGADHCARILKGRPRDAVEIQVQRGQMDTVGDVLTWEPVQDPITCTVLLH